MSQSERVPVSFSLKRKEPDTPTTDSNPPPSHKFKISSAPIGPVIPSGVQIGPSIPPGVAVAPSTTTSIGPSIPAGAAIGPSFPEQYQFAVSPVAQPTSTAPSVLNPVAPVGYYYPAGAKDPNGIVALNIPIGENFNGIGNPLLPYDHPENQRYRQLYYEEKMKKQNEERARERRTLRAAGGEAWVDETLSDWPKNDFRLFVGNLGHDVTDEALRKAFAHFPSVAMVRVIRDKRTEKSKGYGFVSFLDPHDYVKALKTMKGQYIMNRPCLVRKSTWKDRTVEKKSEIRDHKFKKTNKSKPYRKMVPKVDGVHGV